ncbi:sigma-70 family RNA polymerase sigma factor [Thalassotalea sp. G2M2-11]|uniref:RNA polymerase sigma factor n=1 Tax=Thalassotalea sp. G2M2-11 TaxID=2787627 RepID=UPI0019D04A3F|nr:sigma-70 family RNA polymerase sigma factor [Thalassotalea sp. G2M2-11]
MEIWEISLVDELKQGSTQACERCYRLLSSQLYTVIYKVCQNQATAQELLQDTFLDIFEKVHCFKKQQSFVAWCKRIAFNNTLNFIKRNNRMEFIEELPDMLFDEENCVSEVIADSRLIESLFAKISEVERLILWLFIVEQYNHEEIAVLVSKSPSYSKSIVSRALKRIRMSPEVKTYAHNQ